MRTCAALLFLLLGCSDYKVQRLEPRLTLTPTVLDFGAVPAGQSAALEVSVINSGAAPLHLVEPAVTVDGPGALAAVVADSDLNPGQATTLSLTYTPAGEEADDGVVDIADDTELSGQIVWTARGVVGQLSASPGSLDFGSLLAGESATQVLALTNLGEAPVTIDSLSLDGAPGYTAGPLTGSLPLVVGAGDTTVVEVGYLAPDTAPALSTLDVHSDDPHGADLLVPLSANTEAPNNRPAISLVTPAEGAIFSIGQSWTLRAYALDVETPPESLEVSFDSAVLGHLGTVHPDATGEALLDTTAIIVGDDTITATVTDAAGDSSTDLAHLSVTDCLELSWLRDETFGSDFDHTLFALNGSAVVDDASGELVLTDALTWQAGAIYIESPILLQRFHVDITFRIDPGTGADGLAVVAATGAEPDDLLGKTGEQLGVGNIAGVTGFVVEVDVHPNGTRGDPSADHVALVGLPDYQHLSTPYEAPELEDGAPHELVVDFAEGWVTATLDGELAVDDAVPDWVEFEGYLGLTAATGSLTDRHVIEQWGVETGCW